MVRFLVSGFLLSLVAGYCIGATSAAWTLYPASSIRIIDDQTEGDIPVVRIDGIRNGVLIGTVSGMVRLVAGDDPVSLSASGTFTITNTSILTNVIEIVVPPGMHFVASAKGKKYYSITSAGGNQIVPQNRVYFPNEVSAQKAGYTK